MRAALLTSTLAALALGVFGWLDTADYRSQLQDYQTAVQLPLQQLQRQVQEDEARYQRCDALRAENRVRNTIDFTPQGRACLIDALERTASVSGALVLARNAAAALAKDPDDQALRTAALASIARARTLLAGQRPWLYDRLERLQHAQARSRVVRLFGPLPVEVVDFNSQAALLDQAEFAIHLPRLYQSQQVWRLESRLPETG